MRTIQHGGLSRRQFLLGVGAVPFACPALAFASRGAPAFMSSFHELAAPERKRVTIRDVQVMVMQGPGRNYTLVKVTSDAGPYGIAEAYGTPAVGVKEQMLSLKPWLVGKDPLEIDKLYTQMGEGSSNLSGTRTDGSAHLMRAVSGIEMALWDLAGKVLEVPTSTARRKVPRQSAPVRSCRAAQLIELNPDVVRAHLAPGETWWG